MAGVGQGPVTVLDGGGELAIAFHDGRKYGQRLVQRGGKGGRGGDVCSFRLDLVVAGQLGCGPGAGGGGRRAWVTG